MRNLLSPNGRRSRFVTFLIDTHSSKVTFWYRFHPLLGRDLHLDIRSRRRDGAVTVVDLAGR